GKVVRGKRRCQSRRQAARVLDRARVGVHAENLVSLLEQINQVAAETASGVEDAHARRDAPAQDLVEQVNIDLAELLLKVCWHGGSRPVYRLWSAATCRRFRDGEQAAAK